MHVEPISIRDANDYVEQHHRHHGKKTGCRFAIGLYEGGCYTGWRFALILWRGTQMTD